MLTRTSYNITEFGAKSTRSSNTKRTNNRPGLKKCGSRSVNNNDRLYVRLSMKGMSIAELDLVGMTSLSDIISQLRYVASRYRGLAQLHIRNISEGWCMERPLMLYSS